ncbi:MAG: ABC transporter ATP-binding protein, partial [Deltaproteobacteria bacterium]|nr:ABC transporter ATP-binding protein [Deltaproteobacteria bacterium]
MTTLATVENLAFTYPGGGRPALRNVSLEIAPGEALYLTGPSGGGKTTLLRVLNGLAWGRFAGKTEGRAETMGQSIVGRGLREIAAHTRTLFQEPEREFFALTAGDDFLLTMECSGMEKKRAMELKNEWFEKFDLGRLADLPIHFLSSGEKQKAVLAQLLALGPRLLLLDEPTANLDARAARELAGHLKAAKESGVGLIISDHHRYWLGGLADQAAVMDEGELVFQGKFSELDDKETVGQLKLPPPFPEEKSLTPPPPAPGAGAWSAEDVGAEGLSFGYKSAPKIIENFGALFPRGVITALSGPNGSGKTTLGRILAGLFKQSSGTIYFQGKPSSAGARLSATSLAFQDADRQLIMGTVLAEYALATKTSRKDVASIKNKL